MALPTANQRIDAVLSAARRRASAHADEGNTQMAYQTLLRGVRSAQRANSSGQVGMLLRRVSAVRGVKATALGATPAVAAAVAAISRSKSKSKSASASKASSSDAATPSFDSTGKRARFRVRPQRRGGVVVEDQTKVPTNQSS